MEKRLKSWQGWLLFGGSMVVVFVLGLCVSALMERRAELASVFNNRKTVIEGIEARNEVFKSDFPREYQTWTETAKTDFQSEFNGNAAVDVEKIPAILEEYKRELSFQAGKNPTFVLDLSKTKKVKQLEKIEHCVNSLNSLIIR